MLPPPPASPKHLSHLPAAASTLPRIRHRPSSSATALFALPRRQQLHYAICSAPRRRKGTKSASRSRSADATGAPAASSSTSATLTAATSSSPPPLFPPGPSTGDGDTIVALATSPAPSAVAVVRVSGPLALRLVAGLFRPGNGKRWKAKSHSVSYGALFAPPEKDEDDGGGAPSSSIIDEVLVITMRGPRSYTREDVVEVHTHGGPTCAPRVLEALISAGQAGAADGGADDEDFGGTVRLARPGECTLRAFLAGLA